MPDSVRSHSSGRSNQSQTSSGSHQHWGHHDSGAQYNIPHPVRDWQHDDAQNNQSYSQQIPNLNAGIHTGNHPRYPPAGQQAGYGAGAIPQPQFHGFRAATPPRSEYSSTSSRSRRSSRSTSSYMSDTERGRPRLRSQDRQLPREPSVAPSRVSDGTEGNGTNTMAPPPLIGARAGSNDVKEREMNRPSKSKKQSSERSGNHASAASRDGGQDRHSTH